MREAIFEFALSSIFVMVVGSVIFLVVTGFELHRQLEEFSERQKQRDKFREIENTLKKVDLVSTNGIQYYVFSNSCGVYLKDIEGGVDAIRRVEKKEDMIVVVGEYFIYKFGAKNG